MEVKSLLTGTRGVALPFTDYCEPILPDKNMFPEVMDQIVYFGRKAGWDSIEIRSRDELSSAIQSYSSYYVFTVALSSDSNQIYSSFRDSTRRNIKKAVREGVTVALRSSAESVEEFYRLNCETRREHGLPPQPYFFFKNLFNHIISQNLGLVALATYNGRNIAGAVYLHSREDTIYKYGASLKSYRHLRPNNLIMWEAIKWYSQSGHRKLSFGRTEPRNTGLRQYISGWGVEEQIIKYIKYDIKNRTFLHDSYQVPEHHSKIFRNMPLSLLKAVGYLSYRHMG
jgi:lipid II:glycine glycyltransferase (peptidoglycan interpeptide bridge formation enzyme)